MLDCREVAKYFIIRAYQDGRDTDMTNMKVQKLLYYVQSLHLALFDETLFNLSWVNSPLLAAKNLKLQWKPSVCEQNIFHTPSACSGVVH